MTYYDWWVLGLSVFLVILAALSSIPFYQRYLVGGIAARAGIGVPPSLERRLRRRAAASNRWTSIGTLVGFVAAYGSFRLDDIPITTVIVWIALAAASLAGALGGALSALVGQLRVTDEAPVRIARSRVVTMGDYMPTWLHVLAWAIWVVGVAVVAVSMAADGHLVPSLAIVTAAGACLVLFELAGRALLRQGQPAASTDELIWDDALRSSTVRDLLSTAMLPVVFGALATIPDASHHSGAVTFTVIGVFLVVAGYLVYAVEIRDTRTWYLDRLWPHARKRTPEERAERDAAQLAQENRSYS